MPAAPATMPTAARSSPLPDADTEPFRFFHEDGTPLEIGVGNSYIAIAPDGSPVTYTAAEPVAETTAATTAE